MSAMGQPLARNHCKTSKWPFFTALNQVSIIHGQPFAWAHCTTSKCPYNAAFDDVSLSHGQPLSRTHFKTCKCPYFAAFKQVSWSHGQFMVLCNHWTHSMCPCFAAFATVRSFKVHPCCSWAQCSISIFPLPAMCSVTDATSTYPLEMIHLSVSNCSWSAATRQMKLNWFSVPFASFVWLEYKNWRTLMLPVFAACMYK